MQRLLALFFITFADLVSGQSILKVREVFDFNVGDEFEYSKKMILTDSVGYRYTILERRDSKNADSITYKIKVDSYQFETRNSKRLCVINSTIIDTTYTSLDSCICNEFRHKYIKKYPSFRDTVYFHPKWNAKVYGYYTNKIMRPTGDYSGIIGAGIGLLAYYSYFDSVIYIEELSYYKKGNLYYGTHDNHFDLAGISVLSKKLVFYPNPVLSKLYFSESLAPNSTIILMDFTGKEVVKIANANLISEIDMSYLAKGFYYIVLENNVCKSVNKLVKQ